MKKIILTKLLFVIITINLFSQTQNVNCTDYNANGIQYCEVGIPTSILNVTGNETQHMNQWCWAASIQAVFNYYGHNITQDSINNRYYGSCNGFNCISLL